MSSVTVDTIATNIVVDLKMSSDFYSVLCKALIAYSDKPTSELIKMMKSLKDKKIEKPDDLILLILLELISAFEDGAKKQGHVEPKDITISSDSSQEDDPES